ncbi:MAG: hypothetical protein C4346_11560, partial [Chloroflexota bacterium]
AEQGRRSLASLATPRWLGMTVRASPLPVSAPASAVIPRRSRRISPVDAETSETVRQAPATEV